jgi:demethylmenaquinone methyltransferase / 2-methoxy-6-polyprenyl-1,4-benzoquinol methylase
MDTIPKPKLPLFDVYFRYVMPVFGRLLAGSQESYQYLQASTDAFYTPDQLVSVFQEAGLHRVKVERLAFGTVVMVVGEKPFT